MSDRSQATQRGGSRSLGSILALSFFALSLAAFFVAGCLQFSFSVRARNKTLASLQERVAVEAASAVSGFLREKVSVLESALWIASPYALSGPAQRDLLSGLLGKEPAIRRILLLDDHSRVTALVSRRSTAEAEKDDVLRWRDAGEQVRDGQVFYSSVSIDDASGEPLFLVVLPMLDVLRAHRGALIAELNLKFMWNIVDSLRVGRTGYAYVVDRAGELISFGDASRVLMHKNLGELPPVSAFVVSGAAGRGVLNSYKGLKGTRVIGTYLSLGRPEWAVIVELPWTEAYGETIREEAMAFGLSLLLAAIVSLVGIALARRLATQIGGLAQTASRIAAGERELQAEVTGPREVASLSMAFNSMTSQLRASIEELDRYFTNALDLLCIADTDGNFRRLNKEWEAALGYSTEELEGRKFLDFVHPEDKEKTLAEIARLQEAQEVLNFVNRFQHRDGSYRWIEWRSFPYGKIIYAVARDITKRKQDEDEIRRLNESLEERVARRTSQLEAMNRELEAFSYSIAHDLRAPLRAIDGYARIIAVEYAGAFDAEGGRMISVVRKEAQRMDQLIRSLLELSRIGRSALRPAVLDMAAIARSVVEEITVTRNWDGSILRIGELPAARGDPSLIRQVWENLLSNAVKFTSLTPGAVINVEGSERANELVYVVRDNGAGFDMRFVEKLFGVFQRLHSRSQFDGNGIGLALVQRIVGLHGGRVWAEGEVGKGATFFFSLPRVV